MRVLSTRLIPLQHPCVWPRDAIQGTSRTPTQRLRMSLLFRYAMARVRLQVRTRQTDRVDHHERLGCSAWPVSTMFQRVIVLSEPHASSSLSPRRCPESSLERLASAWLLHPMHVSALTSPRPGEPTPSLAVPDTNNAIDSESDAARALQLYPDVQHTHTGGGGGGGGDGDSDSASAARASRGAGVFDSDDDERARSGAWNVEEKYHTWTQPGRVRRRIDGRYGTNRLRRMRCHWRCFPRT